jgi:hypothetical protein
LALNRWELRPYYSALAVTCSIPLQMIENEKPRTQYRHEHMKGRLLSRAPGRLRRMAKISTMKIRKKACSWSGFVPIIYLGKHKPKAEPNELRDIFDLGFNYVETQ